MVSGLGGCAYPVAMSLSLSALDSRCAAYIREQMTSHDPSAVAATDPAHDLMHIDRVVANARQLTAMEGARAEIVIPAAWLHDCVIVPKNSPRRSEASRMAAAEATRLLTAWGCNEDWLPAIAHAIEAHSFSAKIEPRTLEAKVVQDADRLDALGAAGLARMLMLGGFMRKPLYKADDPFCEKGAPDESHAVIDHCYTKLLTLAGTMQTAAGKQEASHRTAFIQRFLDELRRELQPARLGS
jgi:uncharacterized protein